MESTDYLGEAINLVGKLSGVDLRELTGESSAETFPEWDSLVHMEIIAIIEARLSTPLVGSEMVTLGTIAGIARALERVAGED